MLIGEGVEWLGEFDRWSIQGRAAPELELGRDPDLCRDASLYSGLSCRLMLLLRGGKRAGGWPGAGWGGGGDATAGPYSGRAETVAGGLMTEEGTGAWEFPSPGRVSYRGAFRGAVGIGWVWRCRAGGPLGALMLLGLPPLRAGFRGAGWEEPRGPLGWPNGLLATGGLAVVARPAWRRAAGLVGCGAGGSSGSSS